MRGSELRILVAYGASSTYVQTTMDYLMSLKRHLPFRVEYLHVTNGASVDIALDDYDILFQSYCARLSHPGYVSQSYIEQAQRFHGVKILAVQDEYQNTNVLKRAVRDIGFDVVLTCVPQDSLEYVYPRRQFPGVQFETVLTGYVPEDVSRLGATTPLSERPILIGYRGRDIGGNFGRLGFDKVEVGRGMKAACDARGLATDIAWDEDSRIYGPAWLEFVGRCRAMLGSESGSNVFDFDGKIQAKFDTIAKRKGVRPSYEEFRPYVEKFDRSINMGQISPRIFECAIMRTPMILFSGRYSDAVEPHTHYIPLEKDFSNVDDVLRQLEDDSALGAMAERTYTDLVASGRFSYASFCAKLNEIILDKLNRRPSIGRVPELGKLRHKILPDHPTPIAIHTHRFELKSRLDGQDLNALSALDQLASRYMVSLRAHIRLLGETRDTAARDLVQAITARCLQFETARTERLSAVRRLQTEIRMGQNLEAATEELFAELRAWNDNLVRFYDGLGTELFAIRAAIRTQTPISLSRWLALRGLPARVIAAALVKDVRAVARLGAAADSAGQPTT